MGVKGNKLSNDATLSVELLKEKLIQISGITSKKMFGGFGDFHEGKMFALVNSKGEMYLKINDSIRPKFEEAGAQQHGKMPYFYIPEKVFNDLEKLIQWAEESIEISK